MIKFRNLCAIVAAGMLVFPAGAALADSHGEWLKQAQLGPHAPAKQDWAAIEAAAKKEGKVVIYSVSSRIFKLVDKFKEKYGVEIVGHDISSDVQLEKFRREHKANIYQVDVLFNNETPMVLNEFLDRKLAWNFVPDSVAPFLEDSEKEPLLVQRWSSRIVFYNSAKHPDGPPVDNLWDLTRPEWKSKVLMPDPLETSVQANAIQTILQYPEKMAEAYQAEFGEPVKISKAVVKATKKNPTLGEPNASMEWLYRFLQNKPVYLGSTTKIFKNVSDVKQDDPPLGIVTFSKLRSNKAGEFEAKPALGMKPTFGVAYPTVLFIADRAPHPNAAKLLIRHMMEEGFEPWNVIGDYAGRHDVEAKQVAKFGIPPFDKSGLWRLDQTYVYDNKFSFLSLYLALK